MCLFSVTYSPSSKLMNSLLVTCQNASAVAMMRSREMMSTRFSVAAAWRPGVGEGEGPFRDGSLRPALFCIKAFHRDCGLEVCPVYNSRVCHVKRLFREEIALPFNGTGWP